jgi:hypothetical protein
MSGTAALAPVHESHSPASTHRSPGPPHTRLKPRPPRYATPQTEGLAAALEVYESAVTGPAQVAGVPRPVPPHAADPAAASVADGAGRSAVAGAAASDAQYELLLLAANGGRGPSRGPGFVARLLRAAGRTTNPLDAAQGWMLGSTLGALGELCEVDDAGDRGAGRGQGDLGFGKTRSVSPKDAAQCGDCPTATTTAVALDRQASLRPCCCGWCATQQSSCCCWPPGATPQLHAAGLSTCC